ncbi:hypothetical protein [Pseudofulvimonas gallinarii]|uniref:Uncharacterized protein n=1 Tax=Pseudofulvimonas gallinarii TaxID=634155 RepID=A0A4R3LAN7_9GAMM|nr:hypothetical protein [Pseudofulvimonas gallinarii]TCS96205.1 hypothetical protein EDC25_11659 [Pseudofulvimonas gallinarii]THD14635.1 hypothetical protein B1808_02960 [Pseudofulvimonas gallinarii]
MLKTLVRTIIGVALLLASLQLVYWSAVRRQVRLVVEAVAPVAILDFEAVEAFPPGRLALRGVRLAVKGRETLSLHADRVALDRLDPVWMLRWLAGWDRTPLRHLGLRIDGLRPGPELLSSLRRRAGSLGLVLPFEAAGCEADPVFSDQDYAALGWQDPRLDIALQWRRQPELRRVEVGLRVDRYPSGVLQAALDFVDVSERTTILSRGLGGARLDKGTVRYENVEALMQRNAHCGSRLEGGDFIAAHLRRVHELLRGMGIVPDEPIWAAYRGWLDEGGTLTFSAEPAPGVPFSEYADFAPEDRLRLLGLSLQVAGSTPVPVEAIGAQASRVEFRPLPELPETPPVEPEREFASSSGTAPSGPGVAGDGGPPRRAVLVSRRIEFDDVGLHHGEQVRIATVAGGRHVGIVLGSTADAIELQISRYGGAARLPIARDQISRIEVLSLEVPAS